MNTDRTLLNKARVLLGLEVKLEQMKLDNGAILEAEVFEAGAEVFVVADEERVAVPVGEYATEDGMIIVVSDEGIIGEIKEAGAEEEEAPVEEETEEVVEEELATETASPKKIVKSISEEMFFSEIEKLRTEINELKLSKTEVVAEEVVVELSEEVKVELSTEEVEGISHNPENVSDKKELNLYSQKGNKNTTRSRIFNKINK
tara:strand:+ start:8952 stop:9560 length:609 start_codon:yes stop_codon:yes gene_type:complete